VENTSIKKMCWKSTKANIQDWLKERIHEFTYQESSHVGEHVARYKDRYLLECLHEILWVELLVNLHKWMERLTKNHLCWLPMLRVEWTTKNLLNIYLYDHKFIRVVDSWYKKVVKGCT